MASPAEETVVFSTSDDASIALLRRLRAGAAVHFVHHVDVCSAPPEDLVADLDPAPGTDLAQDGYNSTWYFYCPKRFKNAQGKPSGHRQRAIAGGDTCWHSETAPKPVKGLEGATFCNLSFGRKEGSGRSFNRMGWCMTEYDDKNDHVLCKVHRSSSSLAKGKLKPTTKTQWCSSSSFKPKRKATCEHPQAPPSKMSLCASVDHRQLQQNTMFPAAEEQQLHQNAMFPVAKEQQQFQDNTLFSMDELLRACSPGSTEDLSSGPVYGSSCFPGDNFTMDDLFGSGSTGCCNTPKAMPTPDAAFFEGLAF
nr:unnamed protein product [Digitaria exilis]